MGRSVMADNAEFEAAQRKFAVRGIVAITAALHNHSGAHHELTETIRKMLADLREFAPEWNAKDEIDRLDRLLM
jgi:hypothetical protein